jgi:predicted ribonuclease YlaK
VVELVLDSRDRVVSISGAAGTGKTVTYWNGSPRPVFPLDD